MSKAWLPLVLLWAVTLPARADAPFYEKGLFTVLALNEISYSEPNNLD